MILHPQTNNVHFLVHWSAACIACDVEESESKQLFGSGSFLDLAFYVLQILENTSRIMAPYKLRNYDYAEFKFSNILMLFLEIDIFLLNS